MAVRQRIARSRLLAQLLWRKLNLDDLVGFMGCRLPLPVTNRIHRGLRQHGMASFNLGIFHAAIGGHQNLNLHYSLKSHTAGEGWIGRRSPLHQSAHRIGLLGSGELWRNNRQSAQNEQKDYGRETTTNFLAGCHSGSNLISINSLVSCVSGSNFQCPTAVTAL